MGTVGLSFGSPTGGTGFDVNATVAMIVGNLQKIETPWKTQLTTLESQDTAISSLGTLFSNLSNDLSALTDLTGLMEQKAGSSSDNNVLQLTAASPASVAGTHTVVVNSLATTSSGYLAPIAKVTDKISGSITLQVGTSGKPQTISAPASNSTLAGLAAAINSSGVGVNASVLTDASGSRLSLVSGTSGAHGQVIVDASSNTIVDTSNANAPLAYTATSVAPADAQLTVDNVNLTSASNTVTDLIPGLTFQLLAPSAKESDGTFEQIQVVIANDNTSVESTINTMVKDYNSLIGAINVQEGNDSSGKPEPLFGSPTLSLLQQQLLSGLNLQNPNGYIDPIATDTGTTLAGSISIAVGSGKTQTIVIGSAADPPAADTFYTGPGVDANTLQGVADAINAAAAGTILSYSGTAGTDSTTSSGTLTAIPDADLSITGSISFQVGTGTTERIVIGAVPNSGAAANTNYMGDGVFTLADVAGAINNAKLGVTAAVDTPSGGVSTLTLTSDKPGSDGTLNVASALTAAGIGVTANVITSNGQSSLSLFSQTAGASGALTVKSAMDATSDTLLSFSGTVGTNTTPSVGALTAIADKNDALAGSISIQVGNGVAQTVNVDLAHSTLAGFADTINHANAGVTAVVNSEGTTLSFLSGTKGAAGTLTVSSKVLDTTNTTTARLNYTNSSNISGLANLGITMSTKYDGSIDFNATVLTSALNSDYSGVLGFFQNMNSWGRTFATLLNNSGSSSSKGVLSLAASSNSNTESMLNDNITKEESMISVQQKNLTAQLIKANEILQALPSQLEGINQLYSAITGYNQNH